MKKKIIIGVLVVVLVLGTVIYLISKPINNDYIEYTSAEEYKTELINSIESEDYKLASNLIYSIANSEYYDELNQEVVDDKYNSVEPSNNEERLYREFILLLKYIEVIDESSFEITEVDKNELSEEDIAFFCYELNGTDGYYLNFISGNDYIVDDSKGGIQYHTDEYLTDVDFTAINEDYKNDDSRSTRNYTSTKKFDNIVNVIYALDIIKDEDISQEERDELQLKILDIAHETGDSAFGMYLNGDLQYDETSGNISDIEHLYLKANENGKIDEFVEGDYVNEYGITNMNKLVKDYDNYIELFDAIDDDITNYDN